MLEKRNGITLIALVITIIVMLILAGVTISALIGQGNIIENSKDAVGKYNNRVIEEQEILNEVIEYINNSGSIEETGISISVVADTTEVTKKVIVTVEGNTEEGIKSFTSTLGDNKTYVEGTKEIVETCEITENGVYVFTIEDNKGKTANKGILIENIIEGTIQIGVDKTTPTMENVKVTVTWPNVIEGGIKEISKNGGTTWETETEEISTFEIEENCTIKARVRNSTEEVITASLIISNIDKTTPTVTATEGTETITEGDSNEISKYFTWQANGTAGITSVVYTDTSNNNVVVANTNTLSVGTHIIKCTVTKETGAVASTTKTIIVKEKKPEYAKITYTTPGTFTWTVPEGVSTIRVTVAGAGGGGGSANSIFSSKTGAAGGQGGLIEQNLSVIPGQVYSITVGAGGSGAPAPSYFSDVGHVDDDSVDRSLCFGSNGGSSNFGSIQALGGTGRRMCILLFGPRRVWAPKKWNSCYFIWKWSIRR